MTGRGTAQGRQQQPLRRARLVDGLAAARCSLVTAPSGYGKSTLIDQLAERLGWSTVYVELGAPVDDVRILLAAFRRALRAAGLRLLAEAISDAADESDARPPPVFGVLEELLAERDDPVLFVIDDVHHLRSAAAEAVGSFAAQLPPPHHIAFAGLTPPAWSGAPRMSNELGAADLAFTVDEIAAYAGARAIALDPTQVDAILSATAGWPAAVALSVETQVTEPRALRRGIGGLVERVLAAADEVTRGDVKALAQLPLLSAEVATQTRGPSAFEHLLATGIPVRRRSDGWLVLPDPVRDALADEGALDAAGATAAAGAYFEAGEFQSGISLLLRRRAHEALADLLEARPWQDLQPLDPVELRSILAQMPDEAVAAHPRLLLAMARVAEGAAQMEWRRSLLARVSEAHARPPDDALRREIDAELAIDMSYEGDVDGTAVTAGDVLSRAAPGEIRARARALAALGRAKAFARDPASIVAAADAMREAVALLRLVDEPEWLANVLLRLGYSIHFEEGDLEPALARMRDAVEAAPYAARARATVLTFVADVLLCAGELDEAEGVLREVADVGRRLRDRRLLGYHAWMKAGIASRRGDGEALATWLAEAERHPGDWFEHPTGIEFLADAVDMCGRIGDHDRAAHYLARVEGRCAVDRHDGVDQIAVFARAVHGARAGDPAAAEIDLLAVLESQQLPRRETWRMHLLRALAASRAADDLRAASLAGRAIEEATARGHPEWPLIHEPMIAEHLLALAARAGSRAAANASEVEPRIAVRVLGGFGVTAAGRAAAPPPGRPATLVKLLAVAGGPVATDEALEVLWPDIDPETGRVRLRNILSRIRSASGDLIRRDGDALVLAPDVTIDAAEFDRQARAALKGRETDVVAARGAVGRYSGELLPGDRYEDFTVSTRERLELRYLALLDRLANDAERSGDVDEALRLLGEAIAAAPLDEHRYERAASLALSAGRRRRARELVDQAQRVLADLGVEPSDALADIARRLKPAAQR